MSTLEEQKREASEATQRNQVAQAAVPDKQKAWRELAPVMKYLKLSRLFELSIDSQPSQPRIRLV